MNTNNLKKFAQEARRKLLEQVGSKLNFVLTTDSAELREKTEQLKQLRQQLSRTTKEQLIEKVAYIWFNRLMALRFMDVNDYQPLGIKIITPKSGYTIPELLDEAKRGNIPEELKVNRQKIYDLLDAKIPSTNPQNEAFKELLIATCNHLHTTFPFLFEKISDYTELLLPDDLTSDFSIVKVVREGMLIEDCMNVEIIGWLYQFYISEKKDEVIGSKSRIKKEDIPAATQLFTPRWIVEYMVQNTLGKLWLQNRPMSRLRADMPYYIEPTTPIEENNLKIKSPEEIKLLDPASGSGHILVYAFDLLSRIYEEEGYNLNDIPKLIIEKNLFGFEIDDRAAQLTGLALMMKAMEYHRRVLKKDIKPTIICYQDLQLENSEIRDTFNSLKIKISDEFFHDLIQLKQATNFGSLIVPHAEWSEIYQVNEELNKQSNIVDIYQKEKSDALQKTCIQLLRLAEKYHCVVTNPPYMGGGNMNDDLSKWAKINFSNSKSDLFSCFIERSVRFLPENGFCGLVTMESWMFLSSFEVFRKNLLKNIRIQSLTHFGWHVMRIAFGTVSFILQNKKPDNNFKGTYSYLEIDDIDKSNDRPRHFPIKNNGRFNTICQLDFAKIPSSPIGYWLSDKFIEVFKNVTISDVAEIRVGMHTGSNEQFIRLWQEVPFKKINLNGIPKNANTGKWFPYNKGGEFRKWYGNHNYVVNWENSGEAIHEFHNLPLTYNGAPVRAKSFQFRESISWSFVTSGSFAVRYYPQGFMFDVAGSSVFSEIKTLKNIMGLLNSKIAEVILQVFNPTLNFQVGNISSIPFLEDSVIEESINDVYEISKSEWDIHENSWNFKQNELVRIKGNDDVEFEEVYYLFIQLWVKKFLNLHFLEEAINKKLIELYDLSGELTPLISLENISLLQDELDKKSIKRINKLLVRDPINLSVQNYKEITLPFLSSELVAQFLSYSVGVMVGRYSLDEKGLILANQEETLRNYFDIIGKSIPECSFPPDEDNIIPILDNEWFEDDIVSRFYKFLRVTFGEKNFIKNLAFIEAQIDKDIRKYFIKDFYPDHIKRYKKRPIYWMFSSPKGSFNVLIYMHRYTPDMVSNILNKYLKEFIGKLNTRKEHLQRIQVTGSASDKTKAIKEIDNIDKMLVDLHEYERDILYPLATERIEIDLDDGVLVNYNKFGKAVKEVNGINDPATKKKVKQFDWIDTNQIR